MRMRFVLAAGILSLTAVGQVVQVVPRQDRIDLLNEPFSADAVTTLARTLADGTHITRQTMIVKIYRDAAGRSRSDRNPGQFIAGQPAPPAIIMIRDPSPDIATSYLTRVFRILNEDTRETVKSPVDKVIRPAITG